MDITFLGHASFRLKGKNATLVIDPFDTESVGLKFPRAVEANVVTISHDLKDHNASDAVGGSPYIISGPGEYEVKGISVIGIGTHHDSVEGKDQGKECHLSICHRWCACRSSWRSWASIEYGTTRHACWNRYIDD